MAQRRVRLTTASGATGEHTLERVFDAIRAELDVPAEFPADVLVAADEAAAHPDLPTSDRTDVPFFTIDPKGSTDLDQAMHLARDGDGYRVLYAIADVPAFVPPGGPVDAEARRRGQTLYAPDARTPLHPPRISEDAGSLLPDQVRPAFVWDLQLDARGELRSADVARAMVRSVDRLDYESLQADVDAGRGDERLDLLRAVGEARIALEVERGGSSLPLPEQDVVLEDHHYALRLRPASAVEDWNAQISLLTGMAAADIMLAGQVGILRTMPAPTHGALARFRRQAAALGARWPAEQPYGVFLRSLDRDDPKHLALIHEATALFRGAGYTPFDGDVPEATTHGAVADQYAHVTAPLRRLVDRFGLVVCEALCRDVEVPGWVRETLPQLPEVMASSDHQAGALERACTDAVEAAVLAHRVGETFEGVVVDLKDKGPGGSVQLLDPPVLAPVQGDVQLGARLRVRLTTADVEQRRVEFSPA
ncbi:RNB domain-containing ribonuclease [Angustibacter peucedani]